MAEADLYTIVKVARDEDLKEQIGKDIYFDLVDHNKVRSFQIKRSMPFNLFKEEVAKDLGIPVQCQRFWLWAKRQNHTYRPNRPLTPQEEAQSVGQLREVSNKANNAELKLFLDVEPGQVVHFRSLEKPKDDEFRLELSKLHNYDDVVERVARHLGLDDPSKISLTAHNCYSQQPKPQPIKYQGVEHLSDMLVHYNQTSDILYYEVLDIPLPELQGLKTLKVAFHHSTKDEVVIHTIRLPKQSTVGDVINDLKTKVELSHPNAELRLLEVSYHKIYKIFLRNEKIENINDQYWTLRAEEIPEEEKNLGPHDRLIHVYHFMKDTTQNQVQVQNFGEPFLLVIREGEMLADVKVRIQKKLQVPDVEFSKWKFAFLSLGRPDYLQDSDVVSSRFQRRDVYGAWEQYLGLEHSDNTPKRSYAANQIKPEHHSRRGCYTNSEPLQRKRGRGSIFGVSTNSEPLQRKRGGGSIFGVSTNSEPLQRKRGRGTISGVSTTQTHSGNAPASKVRFLAYWVSSEASLLLERIHHIHEDTFTRFSMKGGKLQTLLLESFASFVESMSTTKVKEVQEDVLRQAALSIEDFEQVGLELSWLKKRLEEASTANKHAETALKVGRAKVRELEEALVKAKAELEDLSKDLPNSLAVNDCLLTDIL